MRGIDLKKKREELGLTQVELARHLGVQSTAVSRWERGSEKLKKIVVRALRDLENELKHRR